MKSIRIHHAIKRNLASLSDEIKKDMLELFDLLMKGESIGMPVSRPMPTIAHGVHELRLKDKAGIVRVFYFTKYRDAILVFHIFTKKTQATPKKELDVARKRLEDLL